MAELIGIWVAALLTLCIFSFLYRDNPFYRFAEHLFVGVSVGYGIVLTIHQGLIPFAWNPLRDAFHEATVDWLGKAHSNRYWCIILRSSCPDARLADSLSNCYPHRGGVRFGNSQCDAGGHLSTGARHINSVCTNSCRRVRSISNLWCHSHVDWCHINVDLFFLLGRTSRGGWWRFKDWHCFSDDWVRFSIRQHGDGPCVSPYPTGGFLTA